MDIKFVIDEYGGFKFSNTKATDTVQLGLVVGLVVSTSQAQAIIEHLESNYCVAGIFVKGRSIKDNNKAESFTDFVLANNVYGTFCPGDHVYISLDDAAQYQKWWIEQHLGYLNLEHAEYQSISRGGRDALLKESANLFVLIKEMSPQQFCNLLMIFEVIRNLLHKLFYKSDIIENEEFTSITIIVDSQDPLIVQIIKKDLLGLVLFVMSRQKPFDYSGKKFRNSCNNQRAYLDIRRLIKEIKIVSEEEQPIICTADYIASFTGKTLRGVIDSPALVDKLSLLYENKVPFFHFDPVINGHIDVDIPEKSVYAYNKLIQDIF